MNTNKGVAKWEVLNKRGTKIPSVMMLITTEGRFYQIQEQLPLILGQL